MKHSSIAFVMALVIGGFSVGQLFAGVDAEGHWDHSGDNLFTVGSIDNIGISVTPPAIHSAVTNLSLGGNATISGDKAVSAGAVLDIAQNVFFNPSAAWTKISNDESSRYNQGGGHRTHSPHPG